MALPFLCPEPIGKGLMCTSYITVKTCLSGNEVGHMCEWRVFQMTAEQFRDTQVLDLVPDFEGAWRPGTNTPFCTYALASLSFLLLFLLSLLFLLHLYLLPSLSNIFSLHLLSYGPLYHVTSPTLSLITYIHPYFSFPFISSASGFLPLLLFSLRDLVSLLILSLWDRKDHLKSLCFQCLLPSFGR